MMIKRCYTLCDSMLFKCNAVSYSHCLLKYSIVKVAHEHPAEADDEPEPFILPDRRFACRLHGGHVIVQHSRYGHGNRSAPRTPCYCVPIHSTGDR